jgi:Cytochrome C oxidase, cbb3-type, subunit III
MRLKRWAGLSASMLLFSWLSGYAADQFPSPPPPPKGNGHNAKTPLYTVQDGNKVDPKTLLGWKTWRAMACERCHGAAQEGLVGPALVKSLNVLTKDQFHTTITQGRAEKGMPPFGGVKTVTDNWENLYAYLKGRANGDIMAGHLYPIQEKKKAAGS